MRGFLISIITILLFTGLSFGQTNVSPGEGTLGAAIKAASSGDILVLENGGTYTEATDSVYVIDKVLTIKAQDSEETQPKIIFEADTNLIASTDFFLLQAGASLTLDGIEFYGMSDVENNEFNTTNHLAVIEDNAATISLTVTNCWFHHAGGLLLDAGVGGSMENVTIDNTVVTDCEGGPYFKDGDLTGSATITNSTFINITDRFLRVQSGDAEGYVDHCTVFNASGKRIIMAKGMAKKWVVTNSIFSTFTGSNAEDCIRPGDHEADSLAFCILHNNVGLHKDWEIVSDTSSADPMFRFLDGDSSDLTLKDGSPALTMASDGGAIVDPRWVDVSAALEKEPNGIVTGYRLHQNYPNPFNPTTTIKFDLPASGFTSLKIYNLLGHQVAVLVSEDLNAGSYSFDFDASRLASGIYYYTIQSKGFSKSNKMILIK